MFLGIDLTFPNKKPATSALLDDSGRLLRFAPLRTDADILHLVKAESPSVVGIDAPLSLPTGWGCLEWPCICGACDDPTARRSAETALAALGISAYWTNKSCFIKPMVLRGIDLAVAISDLGPEVIEIYPYASKRRLFGGALPRKGKTTREGRQFLQQSLAALVPGVSDTGQLLSHDELDALIGAYTAYLYANGRAEELGRAGERTIVVPSLQELSIA